MARSIMRRVLPRWLRRALRTAFELSRDAAEDICHRIANRGQTALPPPSLRTIGGGDFYAVGVWNVRNIRQFSALDGKRILEVGCGCGRNALALTTYSVEYHGFDIFKPYIDWCQDNISVRYQNFHFQHANVRNGHYNPTGTIDSANFRFPYEADSFDLVFLTSVFTHMLESEVARYIGEISRVLKQGGQVYATVFLLNKEANSLIAAGKSHQPFKPFPGELIKVVSLEVPEGSIAFDESIISAMLTNNGLTVDAIKYGVWPGRAIGFDYQDVVVARKSE